MISKPLGSSHAEAKTPYLHSFYNSLMSKQIQILYSVFSLAQETNHEHNKIDIRTEAAFQLSHLLVVGSYVI